MNDPCKGRCPEGVVCRTPSCGRLKLRHSPAPVVDEIAVLKEENAKLEALCDATYVAKGADAYHHACETLEAFQEKRIKEGKDPGCIGSLCGAMEWLYARVGQLEFLVNANSFSPNTALVKQITDALETGASELGERSDKELIRPTAIQELVEAREALLVSLSTPVLKDAINKTYL